MNENSEGQNYHDSENGQHRRRRRTPSQYASYIRELTKLHNRSSKKQMSQSPVDDESPVNSHFQMEENNTLNYVLPGKSKKVKLSVIIRKRPRPCLKQRKVSNASRCKVQLNKEKQVVKNNGNSLLDKLLEAVQKIQDDENENAKSEKNQKHQPRVGQQQYKRQYKLRKQKQEEEKYLRYYENYQGIVERLESMEKQLVLI